MIMKRKLIEKSNTKKIAKGKQHLFQKIFSELLLTNYSLLHLKMKRKICLS